MELRQGRQNRKVGRTQQIVSMGFLCVQRTFCVHSMFLLRGLGYASRKILKIRHNEIEFGSNFDWNVTLVLQATYTMIYIIYII